LPEEHFKPHSKQGSTLSEVKQVLLDCSKWTAHLFSFEFAVRECLAEFAYQFYLFQRKGLAAFDSD